MNETPVVIEATARYRLEKRNAAGELLETIEGGDDLDYLVRTLPNGEQERIPLSAWPSQTPAQP